MVCSITLYPLYYFDSSLNSLKRRNYVYKQRAKIERKWNQYCIKYETNKTPEPSSRLDSTNIFNDNMQGRGYLLGKFVRVRLIQVNELR